MLTLVTKFLEPTNSRGSRVKCTHPSTKRAVIIYWDHMYCSEKNHTFAVKAWVKKFHPEQEIIELHTGSLETEHVFLLKLKEKEIKK